MRDPYFFIQPNKKKLNFYGFQWLPFALDIDNAFCREVDRNIMFNRDGCALWVGSTKKKWVDIGKFIPVPWSKNTGGSQELYRKILLYTTGKTDWRESHRFIPDCGNPLCVNPDHVTYIRIDQSWTKFIDYVEEGESPALYYYSYCAVCPEGTWGQYFHGIDRLCDVMNISILQAYRYLRTGRVYKGKFIIRFDKSYRENPYAEDLETTDEEDESGTASIIT